MVLFFVFPPSAIGWIVMPIGVVITLWVVASRVPANCVQDFVTLAAVWTAIAVVCDYLFLVKALNPPDG
jgi:hypothetical protein